MLFHKNFSSGLWEIKSDLKELVCIFLCTAVDAAAFAMLLILVSMLSEHTLSFFIRFIINQQ